MRAGKTAHKISELMAFEGPIYDPKRTIKGKNTMIT